MPLIGKVSGWACIMLTLSLTGCSPRSTGVQEKIAAAKARCDSVGKFSGGPHEASSLFDGAPRDSFEYDQAADALLGRGFKFVEYARQPTYDNNQSSPRYFSRFHEDQLGPRRTERYVRLYLAPVTDEHCAPFKHYVTMLPNLVADTLRWNGLKADQCIAVQLTDELQAEVEHLSLADTTVPNARRGAWGSWNLFRERATGRTIGKFWTGGYRGSSRGESYRCENEAELEKLDQAVANRSNPVTLLPPVTELKRQNFPLRLIAIPETIGPERPDKRSDAKWSKRKFDFEDWQLPGKLIDNGFTALHGRYGHVGGGVGLAGNDLYIVRDGLRRITSVEDEGLPFPSCFGLHRLGRQLVISCDAQKESLTTSKWLRQNWVLVYDDVGQPVKKITFKFDKSILADAVVNGVRDVKFLEDNRIAATAFFSRRVNGRFTGSMQADLVFKLVEESRSGHEGRIEISEIRGQRDIRGEPDAAWQAAHP